MKTKLIIILLLTLICGCQNKSKNTTNSEEISEYIITDEAILTKDVNPHYKFIISLNSEKILEEYNIDLSTYSEVDITLECNKTVVFDGKSTIEKNYDDTDKSENFLKPDYDYAINLTAENKEYNNSDDYYVEINFDNQTITLQE